METLRIELKGISLTEEKFLSLTEFDMESFYSLFDERGLILFPDGSIEIKPMFMEKLNSREIVFRNFEIDKIITRSYGTTTVIQGEGYFNFKLQNEEINEVLNFIDVWVEKEEGWKLVSSHLTKLV